MYFIVLIMACRQEIQNPVPRADPIVIVDDSQTIRPIIGVPLEGDYKITG